MQVARPRTDPELSGRAALVRSWNVYHGRTDPPGNGNYLEHAVRLACADTPHLLCLQEVPPWALARLGDWAGMVSFGDVTRRPSFGVVPISSSLGRRLTSLDPTRFRSAFSGQANAILVRPELRPREHRSLPLNSPELRSRFEAELTWRDRLAWRREQRRCQMVRVTLPDGRPAVVANLHATSHASISRLAELELERAMELLERLARPGEVIVLAGDFNIEPARSNAFQALSRQGFSPPGPDIDHVLVRGADVSPLSTWTSVRRRQRGVLLSDHAPVELTIVAAAPTDRADRRGQVQTLV